VDAENPRTPTQTEFPEKFIAFIDILGFKNLVEQAEAGRGIGLARLLELRNKLGEERRPTWCPQSERRQDGLDFCVSQVSDSVIVSAEISPAGVINLVAHCWGRVMHLLESGIMCRGYITRGRIFHTSDHFPIGTGFHRAYEKEKDVAAFKLEANERGTPFVEVDRAVCDYVSQCGDRCVEEMFSRCVKGDGTVVALFPFKRLGHQFVIGSGRKFDPEKERRSNQNVRTMLHRFKELVMTFVDTSNRNAVAKAEHYIKCLDDQIEQCDRTEETITRLASPFPRDQ
jgi:hypothetical protein